MKAIRLPLIFLFVLTLGNTLAAQVDPAELAEVDGQIAVVEANLTALQNELADLDQAMTRDDVVVWASAGGWSSATIAELESKIAFAQFASARPESRDRTDRIAGMGLPPALAEAALTQTNRPARRLLREWMDGEGMAAKKELAPYHQSLKRTTKMAESWLAELRGSRRAMTTSAAQAAAYPQGPCYVPAGMWSVGSTKEVLDIRSEYLVSAIKTKGSRNVPAGKISFYLHPRTCDAGLQEADEGFVDPRWIRSRVEVEWITPGSQFSIDWPERGKVVYTKAD